MGRKRQEAMLLAPGQQILFKEPGELLQGAGGEGQRAAAIQDNITYRGKVIEKRKREREIITTS